MVLFGVMVEDNEISINYFLDFSKKLKEKNLFRNPFTGKVKRLGSGVYVLDLNIIYPRVYYIGLIVLFIGLLLSGFKLSAWLIPGLFILSWSIFWSRYFFLLMLWGGLKKKGYSGKLKLMGKDNIIRGLWI